MERVQDDQFITIHGWMRTRLGLKTNELFLYALIYGYNWASKKECLCIDFCTTLFELIDARNTTYPSTIFTSNHSIDELAKVLAKNPKTDKATVSALVDRIAGMTYPLHFGGKSWRQK